eukprot:m.83848 g.83848  ORF g.83848 m.83848 type:complete len:124 (-) comp14777_c2_seq1:81-452(-)
MLRPRALADVLRQTTTGGVRETMLVQHDGSLVAYANQEQQESQVAGAIASNIWSAYTTHSSAAAEPITQLLVECESGNLLVTRVGQFLLCLMSDSDTGFGMLKAKAQALKAHLEEPLSRIQIP